MSINVIIYEVERDEADTGWFSFPTVKDINFRKSLKRNSMLKVTSELIHTNLPQIPLNF